MLNAEQRKTFLDRDIKNCSEAQPRWDAVWKDAVAAESLVDPARRDYYQAEMLAMIAINRESNRMLLNAAQAERDSDAGDNDKAQAEAAAALKSLDEIMAAMHTAEYGKWKNWYRGDWLHRRLPHARTRAGLPEPPEGSDGQTARASFMERLGSLLPHHAV